ncbi:uncharacterized protein LOC129271345 [Lytechinus pictus]|uniref:uncharacterized protein LOC129271345 n=1 Tax=Lytechinus pictus TaxID=7653 RepID=UPI0030B9F848
MATLWTVEAQFLTRGISVDETKYAHVVSALQPEIAQEVPDILIDPPTSNPYTRLRAGLVRRTSVSEQKRLQQLLIKEELGDRKPSQLLHRMGQLLETAKIDDTIFKQLFLQRLPHHVQAIFASSRDTMSVNLHPAEMQMSVNQLADLADSIVDVGSAGSVSSVQHAPSSASEIVQLREQVDKLTAQVNALTTQLVQERGRSTSRHRSNSSRRQSSSRSDKYPMCWYHFKHGASARKCLPPCPFQGPQQSTQGKARASRD